MCHYFSRISLSLGSDILRIKKKNASQKWYIRKNSINFTNSKHLYHVKIDVKIFGFEFRSFGISCGIVVKI